MAFVDTSLDNGCDVARPVNIHIFNTLGSVSTGGAGAFGGENGVRAPNQNVSRGLTAPSGQIIPELQQLGAGDLVPISPDGAYGFTVHTIVPDQYMIWGAPGEMSWLWYLDPTSDSETRLITRVRLKYRWTHPTILFYLFLDVGDIVMMRKCMLGIKERAEALVAERHTIG